MGGTEIAGGTRVRLDISSPQSMVTYDPLNWGEEQSNLFIQSDTIVRCQLENFRFSRSLLVFLKSTPQKINEKHKNQPIEKENHLQNLHFCVPC